MIQPKDDPISASVAAMRPKRYTVKQAAEIIGRSPDTLRRWRAQGVYEPSHQHQFGKLTVGLYDADDIKNLKNIAKNMKTGRKPKDATS